MSRKFARLPVDDYSRIQEAGAAARRRGRRLEDCPYSDSSAINKRRAVAWRSGWTRASDPAARTGGV